MSKGYGYTIRPGQGASPGVTPNQQASSLGAGPLVPASLGASRTIPLQAQDIGPEIPDELPDGSLSPDVILGGVNQSMVGTLEFSASARDEIAWTSGTLVIGSTSYSIDAGSVTGMSDDNWRYVFMDPDTSGTVLQETQTPASAVGDGKVLVAATRRGGDATQLALILPISMAPAFDETIFNNDAITARVIGSEVITTDHLGAGIVTAAKIAAGTITATEIAAGTITTTEIAANTIQAADIAAATITGTEIAANTIQALNIQAGTITGSEIAANTIAAANIAAATITTAEIAAATIVGSNVAAGTITGSNIAATTITASNIASATITTTQIAASTITGSNIAAATISASNISAGTITTTEIAAGTILAANIAAGTIEASNIKAGTITADRMVLRTITGGYIDLATVLGENVAAGEITGGGGGHLASATITAANIAALTITANEIAASTITANELNVSYLSSISVNVGTVWAGLINNQSSSPVAGMRLDSSPTKPATWQRYIDLSASGTDYFLYGSSDFWVKANGDAYFGGTLAANVVAASNILANTITVDELATLTGGGLTINFAATGSNPCLSHSNFSLNADGSADFGGTVSATSFTGAAVTIDGTIACKAGGGGTHVSLQRSGTAGQVLVTNLYAGGNVYSMTGASDDILTFAKESGTHTSAVLFNFAEMGFFNTTPAAQPSGYTTFTNLSTDRTCDANSTSVAELADILGTVIEDLKDLGVFSA